MHTDSAISCYSIRNRDKLRTRRVKDLKIMTVLPNVGQLAYMKYSVPTLREHGRQGGEAHYKNKTLFRLLATIT